MTKFYGTKEQGVYMLATVLKSGVTVEVTKSIMRTFTKLKKQSVPYFDLIKRLEAIKADNTQTKNVLSQVVNVINNMDKLQNKAEEETKKMGFLRDK